MKRLICLILAIVMTLGVLVSCEENLIDEANTLLEKNQEKKPADVVEVALDFYIISGEGSVGYANQTVANKIRDEFDSLYNTIVTMHFVTADQYAKTVLDAHTTREEGKISVALVNSEELYNELASRNVLVNFYDFYFNDTYKTYATLKKQIENLLPLTYGTTTVTVTDPTSGEVKTENVNTSYAVPNNHVFGEYEYVLINEAMAIFCGEVGAAEECDTEEEALALIEDFKVACNDDRVKAKLTELGISADEIVQYGVKGNYEDIVAMRSSGWYCNISDIPEASLDDVYSSCFVAIGDQALAERAMQIIYKINTDTYFRNLLQYGVRDINYKEIIEGGNVVGVTRIKSQQATYNMSLKYTGDIFKAYYCEQVTEVQDGSEAVVDAGVCIFCTEADKCADGDHIYWIAENRQNCEDHVATVKMATPDAGDGDAGEADSAE